MPPQQPKPAISSRTKKILSVTSIVVFVLFALALTWVVGRPMIQFITEPERFRAWVNSHGVLSRIVFVGMVTLQVVIALIPGEPLEIGAGYAFGIIEGTLLCLLGIVIGSAIIFGLVRRFGVRLIEVFFPIEKIRSLRLLREKRKLNTLVFVLMFIPGTPKDLLSYAVGLTDMKFSTWLLISGVARIPSVVTSTIGGSALGSQDYPFAIITFAVTAVISAAGLILYNYINKRRQPQPETDTEETPPPDAPTGQP